MDLKATNLSQAEAQALQAFAMRLQGFFPGQIHQLSLFGSKTRGEGDADSDVDVLVIINQDDRSTRREIIDIPSDLSLEYDVLLSPRFIGAQRWKDGQGSSLYCYIARDAIPLPLK